MHSDAISMQSRVLGCNQHAIEGTQTQSACNRGYSDAANLCSDSTKWTRPIYARYMRADLVGVAVGGEGAARHEHTHGSVRSLGRRRAEEPN
jgi:hypothetical protein